MPTLHVMILLLEQQRIAGYADTWYACTFFKSVGLNVALDTVVQFSLMYLIGWLVMVGGDDPRVNSSQNKPDNRTIYHMVRLTVFEAASPKEACLYYKYAAGFDYEEK